MYRPVELAPLALPEFGLPTVEPIIPAALYRARLKRLIERAGAEGDDVFVVYGDREHFANMAYLTGYDPRFEEALLIIDLKRYGQQKALLLVGNEGLGYVNVSPIKDDFEIVLYQDFSLLGQPRGQSRSLAEILRAGGVAAGRKVGVAGWKYYNTPESTTPERWLEVPSYLVDALRELAGGAAQVRNAGHLFMDASHGMRATNEVEQLAAFEFASTFSSQSVRNVLFGLRPGMTELEACELMRLNGLPASTYTFLASGARAVLGMVSPSLNRVAQGDRFTVCCALWGALTCRAGFAVENAQQLPAGIQDYVDKLA
ncbi:MAG: aminopeptidase P family N-terminal domain-containing protein, partial [Chloroflexota bacterium]